MTTSLVCLRPPGAQGCGVQRCSAADGCVAAECVHCLGEGVVETVWPDPVKNVICPQRVDQPWVDPGHREGDLVGVEVVEQPGKGDPGGVVDVVEAASVQDEPPDLVGCVVNQFLDVV